MALKSLKDKAQILRPCTGSTRLQYGLPCTHELVEFIKANKGLTKADVSSFWWLKREIKDPYTALKPPPLGISKGRPANEGGPFGQEAIYKVPRPKGRTTTGIPNVGRRNYSQFELGESPEIQDAVEQAEQRCRGRLLALFLFSSPTTPGSVSLPSVTTFPRLFSSRHVVSRQRIISYPSMRPRGTN